MGEAGLVSAIGDEKSIAFDAWTVAIGFPTCQLALQIGVARFAILLCESVIASLAQIGYTTQKLSFIHQANLRMM